MEYFAVVTDGMSGAPKWLRTCLVAEGACYMPAAIVGPEAAIVLCAAYDGAAMLQDSGHVYVAAEWLRREYPAKSDDIAAVERRCLSAVGTGL